MSRSDGRFNWNLSDCQEIKLPGKYRHLFMGICICLWVSVSVYGYLIQGGYLFYTFGVHCSVVCKDIDAGIPEVVDSNTTLKEPVFRILIPRFRKST